MSLPDAIPVNPAIARDQLTDGRARFREIVAALNDDHGADLPDARSTQDFFTTLADEPQGTAIPVDVSTPLDGINIIAVPGFLTECVAFLADCLTDGLAHLQTLGARTSIAPVAGRGGCDENARRLRNHLVAQDDARLTIVLPMSKGTADTLVMLAKYPETAVRIDAVASLVGCVCGSPLHGLAPDWLKWVERTVPLPTCARFGGAAVHDLSPETRVAFLNAFRMPEGVRTYSLCAAVGAEEMSAGMMPSYRALSRIDRLNDGQMLLADQIMPGSTFLGALNCDHIATAMPFNRNPGALARFVTRRFLDRNAFAREIMVEAMVRQIMEDFGV
ncbi:hypothetical protein [Magnetovibrio sp.]|uniref:hypothetical protein n=1 Tax=Magnetovibrio sp. TaxID=2024836 RepID=UPI002F9525A1